VAVVKELASGALVRHSTLGVGKVVAVEAAAVHVFFAEGEKGSAAKLRLPAARAFLQALTGTGDERLENLPPFSLDPATGRYAPAPKARPKPARKGKK
jgi:hypothetical protein